ncbi:MAG: ComC/BlpC family leader-containing pheromone/bacteriocin [Bacteroidales bacterium]|nr:ComC/BlpC family leader-containing pheromone/bacteriocin [Bacteroidales bacterium]
MKTLKKEREKKEMKGFKTLKTKELLQIMGGDGTTQKDGEIH